MKIYFILNGIVLLLFLNTYGQIDTCEYYVCGSNSIFAIFEESDKMLLGSDVALVEYDIEDQVLKFYDELSHITVPSISAIARDSTGKLWLGTGNPMHGIGYINPFPGEGLLCFDGEKWSIFNTENSPLPSNSINTLAVDSRNNLWIGCGCYVVRYDGNEWSLFRDINTDFNIPWRLINKITIDADTLWIGTNGGLVKYDGNSWKLYNGDNSGLESVLIYDIEIDSLGCKWIACGNSVTLFDNNNWTVIKDVLYAVTHYGVKVHDIDFDKEGNLWVGTTYGLAKFDGNTWYGFQDYEYLSDEVYRVYVDRNDLLWFSTYDNYNKHGLFTFDGAVINYINTSKCDLSSNYIYKIKADLVGNIWIGTSYGMTFYNNKNWTSFFPTDTGLYYSYITDFDFDSHNNLWSCGNNDWIVGSEPQGGLVKYNGQHWETYNQENGKLPSQFVSKIVIDENDIIWLASYDGLLEYNGSSWTIYNTDNSSIPSNSILNINKYNNMKWVCTANGLVKIENDNWTVFNTTNSGLPSNKIWDCAVDDNGILWICTEGGIAKYDGTWSIFNTENSDLPSNNVYRICINGNIKWFGIYGQGLVRFDDNTWHLFTDSSSFLLDNDISSLFLDANNNLWIGDDGAGICVYNPNGINLKIENQEESIYPNKYLLYQNYPNPFNAITTIKFDINQKSNVSLSVYNINGQIVENIYENSMNPGSYKILWNACKHSSGLYFIRLMVDKVTLTRKCILLK